MPAGAAASAATGTPSAALPLQALDSFFAVFNALRGQVRDALADGPDGLAPMHLRMLKHCLNNPGARQQALVQASGRDKGQIARLVKDLDDRGLLTRQADPGDGRSHCLRLTPAGRAALQRFQKHETAIARRMFGPLPAAELRSLIETLGDLRARLVGDDGG